MIRLATALLPLMLGAAQTVRSVYTSLDPDRCRTVSTDEEVGGSVQRCGGVAGYSLVVTDGDARMTIDVVAPGGRVHRLNYWSVITHNFSTVGPRAEWRMRGTRPIALIVRVNANEDLEDPSRITSYLAVARITPRGICVTDRIGPVPGANELARRAADAPGTRPCLRDRSESR